MAIHGESDIIEQGEMGMWSKSNLSQTRGFTLIEISIVLVVIGLLISGGLVALAPVLENAKRTETENTITKIEDALTLYAIQYGCLPCPANGSIAAGAAGAGQALSDNGTYTANCVDDAGGTSCSALAQTNVVPWATLGLQESDAIDGWNNRLNYHLTLATPVYDSAVCATPTTDPYSSGMYRCGVNYPSNAANFFIVQDTAGNTISNPAQGAVYVIISQGPNGDGAYGAQAGVQRAVAAGSASETENTDADTTFVQDIPNDRENVTPTPVYFDDIVRWKTAPIFIQGCGESACGNAPYVTPPP